jgi:hypothetical protein
MFTTPPWAIQQPRPLKSLTGRWKSGLTSELYSDKERPGINAAEKEGELFKKRPNFVGLIQPTRRRPLMSLPQD